jgi:hypothetical protein
MNKTSIAGVDIMISRYQVKEIISLLVEKLQELFNK